MDVDKQKIKQAIKDMRTVSMSITNYLNTGVGDIEEHINRTISILNDISNIGYYQPYQNYTLYKIKTESTCIKRNIIDVWKFHSNDTYDMTFRCLEILGLMGEVDYMASKLEA